MIRTALAHRAEVIYPTAFAASMADDHYGVIDQPDPVNHPGVSRLTFYLCDEVSRHAAALFPHTCDLDGVTVPAHVISHAALGDLVAPVDTYIRQRVSSALPADPIANAWFRSPTPAPIRYLAEPVLSHAAPGKSDVWAAICDMGECAGVAPLACYGYPSDHAFVVIPPDADERALDRFRVLLRLKDFR